MSESSLSKPVLVIATGNRKKAAELVELLASLGLELKSLADFGTPREVDETGQTFAENAALKATEQARNLKAWVLADDSGLLVDALKGEPGVYSARYAGAGASDADNRAKLLAALAGVPAEKRSARFECHLALADPTGAIRAAASGACHGRIRSEDAGTGGFGSDPWFEVVEYHRTFGELSAAVKGVLSHRARAIYHVLPKLAALLENGQFKNGQWCALG